MKKVSLIWLAVLVCALSLRAETVVLRSGKQVSGQIVVQNEQVIILRDATGARFQFPMSEVEKVLGEPSARENADEQNPAETPVTAQSNSSKKAAMILELSGGTIYENNHQWGGYEAVDLVIGSRKLGERIVTLGGAIGYMGAQIQSQRLNFLPICLALRMPVLEGTHQPLVGLNLGYGVALSKSYMGGLHAGLDIGYRYHPHSGVIVSAGLNVRFQQSTLPVQETINNTIYANHAGRNLVALGIKLGLLF